MRRALLLLVFCFSLTGAASALEPGERLSDPALEARARALSAELRCMVCQNQSIDDSDAPLAHDLRVLLRERLSAGDSDAEVIDFLVARYGEFILLRPRLNRHTAFLWAAPPAVLVIGAIVAFFFFRRRTPSAVPPALDETEKRRLDALLRDEPRNTTEV